MKHGRIIGLLFVAVTLAACHSPVDTPYATPPSRLLAIDSLMQIHPDSALTMLLDEPLDDPYYHLLLSEALYKNDYEQTNRAELLKAKAYYDSAACPFLAARCHYMNGVGYYEQDSVVAACEEYLKASEIMEEHFPEKEGHRAKFMALVYTHLCVLFSDQYLHEQAIQFGKQALYYYYSFDAESWNIAWMLDEIGSQYEMKEDFDSAIFYYQKGIKTLSDTNNITYRDLRTHMALNSYKNKGDVATALKMLYGVLKQAESERESLSRCLVIGSVYYYDFQYDSAYRFLSKVYNNTKSLGSKKISAEWLVDICNNTDRSPEAQEYASFLTPFANIDEKQGELRSQLINTCIKYEQDRKEYLHRQMMKKNTKQVGLVISGLLLVITGVAAVSFFNNKKKHQKLQNRMEMTKKQLEEERHAHRVQQAALGGRLKQKNQALKDLRSKTRFDQPKKLPPQDIQGTFIEEPVCKHILMVCKDKNKPIKSTIHFSAYADIALSNKQKAQLKEAANKHYGDLFERIKKQFPELKEKDYLYCYLSLLGLNNTQIAVLLQNTPSTIWDREQRIKRILGRSESVAITLNSIISS